MRKLPRITLALFAFWFAWVTPILSQTVTAPIGQNADVGAYNASPLTCTTGKYCQLQTDVNGNLKITGSTTPVGTQSLGSTAFAASQISITSSGVIVAAARTGAVGTGRRSFCITNITGTSPIYISGSTPVTSSNGMFIAGTVGASQCWDTQSIVYGISGGGSQTASYSETF